MRSAKAARTGTRWRSCTWRCTTRRRPWYPRYARWSADRPAPPPGPPLLVEAALAGAAAKVLIALHPADQAGVEMLLRLALARLPAGPERDGGAALGQAVGRAAVARRASDGYRRIRPFLARTGVGQWRPELPAHQGSNTTDAMPFLFPARDWPGTRPPPEPDSATLAHDALEASALGGDRSPARTAAQTEAAIFWAYQSSQRGFVLLAVRTQ